MGYTSNGEGNIRKRKDGRWEGRYTAGYDPETGKRLIKNVLGKTQAEVKEKLKIAISESQRLDVSKAGTYTVASWVKTWYEVYAEPRIRPNTKAYYTNYIENHIVPGIGSVPLDKLTTIQIQRLYNNLQKSGRVQRKNFPELKDKSLSPRVVRGVHTLLHNCLEQAVAEHLLLTNPAQGCKLPQLEKKEMKILPQEKIGMYLTKAPRASRRFLSGTDHRPAERGVIGPPMDGLGCGEQNAFYHKAGKSNQRGAGGQSAQNTQLRANAGSPSAGSRPADCRAQKAPSQSVSVPIAQDRNHV